MPLCAPKPCAIVSAGSPLRAAGLPRLCCVLVRGSCSHASSISPWLATCTRRARACGVCSGGRVHWHTTGRRRWCGVCARTPPLARNHCGVHCAPVSGTGASRQANTACSCCHGRVSSINSPSTAAGQRQAVAAAVPAVPALLPPPRRAASAERACGPGRMPGSAAGDAADGLLPAVWCANHQCAGSGGVPPLGAECAAALTPSPRACAAAASRVHRRRCCGACVRPRV